MTVLKVTHNAGFFSCATLRLLAIMMHTNNNGALPDVVDSSEQFYFYKGDKSQDIVPEFYEDKPDMVVSPDYRFATMEQGEITFTDYSKLLLPNLVPFVEKYFSPSHRVRDIIAGYESKYSIDYENTCAVFYRGNDKKRECDYIPYSAYIDKAREVLAANPNIKFLVQPDETEFLEAFVAAFPDRCFWFEETPHMRRMDSAIFYELPDDQKTAHGCNFLGAVIAMSKCKHLITHSGNGSMWCVLYRGNMENVFQFRTETYI